MRMTKKSESLAEFRAEIDRVDNAMHDLLMERARIVRHIARAKAEAAGVSDAPVFAMRPGREAEILRRLAERHTGEIPTAVVGRIWRELISAKSRMQGPLEVAVFGSQDPVGYWDVARSHFGSNTPALLMDTTGLVLRRVADKHGTVGVLPTPGTGVTGCDWWPALAGNSNNHKRPQIVARIPFFRTDGAAQRDAVAVACVDREETGDDRTYLVAHCPAGISRASVQKILREAGVETSLVDAAPGNSTVLLFDADGYIIQSDPRLASVEKAWNSADAGIVVIGGYASPYRLPA